MGVLPLFFVASNFGGFVLVFSSTGQSYANSNPSIQRFKRLKKIYAVGSPAANRSKL